MLSVVGLSHKTAPLHVRERLAFAETELPAALRTFAHLPGVTEALILSTCNRTEAYLVSSTRPSAAVLAEALGALRSVPAEEFGSYLRVMEGEAASRHALRVAGGLESMIVGEAQVLGQVRRAFRIAREAGTTGPVLNRLMQLAIGCGRRVRTETELGRRTVSVPHAAAALARRTVGGLGGRVVVIVGAGEMAALVAKVFAAGRASIAAIANRTVERAAALASRYQTRAAGLSELPALLRDADLAVVATAASAPVITQDLLREVGRTEPLLVIDIGVPRGVAADAGVLPWVTLYDLDALTPAEGAADHTDDLALAEDIVEEALEAFVRWLASRAAVPVIAALHHRAERIVDGELARARSRLSRLDERERRAVRGVVEGALRKLLHVPFVRLRARGDDARVLELARELFDLDGEVPERDD